MRKVSEGVGDAAILVRREDHRRLEALRDTEFEPFWSVVKRLLDEHEERSRLSPPEGRAREVPA